MVFAVVIAVMWALYCIDISDIQRIMGNAKVDREGSFETQAELEQWFEKVVITVRRSQTFRVFLAIYPFIICSRFFKSFAAQPRLALVTRTLSVATNDILHFG